MEVALSGNESDTDLENVLDDEPGDDSAGNDSDAGQGPDQDAPADDNKDKRINDLMSKWQKAEARAKELEAKLPKPDAGGAKDKPAEISGEVQQWIESARAQARDQVYASDPRFAEYGLDRGSITGATPAEMADSARKMTELFDQLESKVQQSVLRKHGLSPEVKSSPAGGKTKSYSEMSQEEFEKELSKVKSTW